jgi:hypothetical protein
MAHLLRPLTPEQLEAMQDAARIALDCYDSACSDAKVIIPTPLHAAMFKLKQIMEGKLP